MTSPVRATIAHCILGDSARPSPTPSLHTLGNIQLYAHQITAYHRIQTAIAEFGGALLCDDVGLGKTYIALAVAAHYPHIQIIAPAVLHPMWHEALARTNLSATLISFEALSHQPQIQRSAAPKSSIVIIDEAHHARTPSTKRYAAITKVCDTAATLLLSATPIHNTYTDLLTLLTLIVGDRAAALTPEELGKLIIRRTQSTTNLPQTIPTVPPTTWIPLTLDDTLLDTVLQLPPAMPPAESELPHTLIVNALIRQWTSSNAALRAALQRRLGRATAMLAALDEGRYPTLQELQIWTIGDDTLQLAFPTLLPPSSTDTETLARAVREHTAALTALYQRLVPNSLTEPYRASLIRDIRQRHPGQRIVAFSQYAATVHALFRTLRNDGAVAALTAAGGLIASGPVARNEVIARFAPSQSPTTREHPAQPVTLLITTDLLSEGVNLQDAAVIIHLDLPWTAAKLEQRVGRVARLGSTHTSVAVYGFLPPHRTEEHLHTTTIIQTKATLARQAIGELSRSATCEETSQQHHASIPEFTERIQNMLRHWRDTSTPCRTENTETICAQTWGQSPGFLAACHIDAVPLLVVGTANGHISTEPSEIWHTISTLHAHDHPPTARDDTPGYHQAKHAIHQWFLTRRAATDAGIPTIVPMHKRARGTRTILRHLASASSTTSLTTRASIAPLVATAYQTLLRRPIPQTPTTCTVVALLLIEPAPACAAPSAKPPTKA